MTIEQNFAKDLSNLQLVVNWASHQQLYGSYADRRPDLGRMFRCHLCGRRRRANGPRCCNAKFTETRRAWDPNHNVKGTKPDRQEPGFGPTTRHEKGFYQDPCAERSNDKVMSRGFLKRFQHKKHGQSTYFKIRQLTFIFQNDEVALKTAAEEIQVKVPEAQHIGNFAEKYFYWKAERRDRTERDITKLSRKANRGERE